jgi:hypothetical protein
MPGADLVGRSGPAHVDGELGGIVRRLPGEELDLVYRSARGHLYGLLRCRIRNTRASGPPMAGAGWVAVPSGSGCTLMLPLVSLMFSAW